MQPTPRANAAVTLSKAVNLLLDGLNHCIDIVEPVHLRLLHEVDVSKLFSATTQKLHKFLVGLHHLDQVYFCLVRLRDSIFTFVNVVPPVVNFISCERISCVQLLLHSLQLLEVRAQLIGAELEVTADLCQFKLKEALQALLLQLRPLLQTGHATQNLLHLIRYLLLLHTGLLC